jgi:hypothetical protein
MARKFGGEEVGELAHIKELFREREGMGCKQVSNGVRSSKETAASDFRDVSVYPFHKSLF